MIAIRNLKLDAIPDLSDPQVIVFTEWMGRSPTLIEDQVTYPIVSTLLGAPDVTDVRGYSMFGMSFVYVVFEDGTDIYWARTRVLEYLNGLRGRAAGRRRRRRSGPTPPASAGSSSTRSSTRAASTASTSCARFRTSRCATRSAACPASPRSRASAATRSSTRSPSIPTGCAPTASPSRDVGDAIRALEQRRRRADRSSCPVASTTCAAAATCTSLGDLEKVAVRTAAGGTPGTACATSATVRFGPDIRRGLPSWNGEGEAVGAIVVMRYGENALDVIERVKTKLEELQPSLPRGVELVTAYDRSA